MITKILLYIFTLAITLSAFYSKAEDYDYKKSWEIRARIGGLSSLNCLITVEDNFDKYDWEPEPEKVVLTLFSLASTGDNKAFSSYFEQKTDKDNIEKFYDWLSLYTKYWDTMDIVAVGHSLVDSNLVFFAVVSGNEKMTELIGIDMDTQETLMKGFKKVIYLRKTNDVWKVDLNFSDKNLEALIDEEVFISCYTVEGDNELRKKKRIEKEKKKREENAKEWEGKELSDFIESNSEYYAKEDLIRKYHLIRKLNSSDRELKACNTPRNTFVYLIKNGLAKVLERPILIPDIGAPLEKGISGTNPVDFIRRRFYDEYTKPDENRKMPNGYEFTAKNLLRRDNQKTFQIIYYTKLEFDGEFFYQLSGLLFNPQDRNMGKCGEYGVRLKVGSENILDDADTLLGKSSFLGALRHTNASLDQIIRDDKTNDEYLYGCSGSGFEAKLKKHGLYPLFRIHEDKDCMPFKPGMDLESLPTLKIDENTFKETK